MVTDEMVEKAVAEMARQDITFANCDSTWQKRTIRAALEAALSAAEPVATVAEMGVGGMRVLMPHPPGSADHLPIGTELYAAPPAPSVAVEDLIADVHGAIDEYREGMKGIEFGPNEWPTVDGVKTVIAQCLRRSALSAQVQDVAEVSPVDYMRRHDAAIAAYEANTPNDYRYSALALRKAVDAAFAVAAAPAKQEGGADE